MRPSSPCHFLVIYNEYSLFIPYFASVLLSASAQLSLKKAAALSSVGADTVVAFLARLPVSKAYPFVAIGIAMTSVEGVVFCGEQISVLRLTSMFLIAIGISLLAAS